MIGIISQSNSANTAIINHVYHVDFKCDRYFNDDLYLSFFSSSSCSGIYNKVEVEKAARRSDPKMSIGVGGVYSATSGAKIVASLPPKLQIPAAVPQKRVGNNFTIDR